MSVESNPAITSIINPSTARTLDNAITTAATDQHDNTNTQQQPVTNGTNGIEHNDDNADCAPTNNVEPTATHSGTTTEPTTITPSNTTNPVTETPIQPSNEQLIAQIRTILETADLSTTTAKQIRKSLEAHFHVDLSERKSFLNEQIMSALADVQGNDDEQDNEEQDDEDNLEPEMTQEERDRLLAEELAAEMNSGRRPRREAAIESDRKAQKSRQFQRKMDQLKENKLKRKELGLPDDRPKKKSKPVYISESVRDVIGEEEMGAGDAKKELWKYIKEHQLQNPNKKSEIICDDKLFAIFQRKTVTMFNMNKLLTKHIKNLDQ